MSSKRLRPEEYELMKEDFSDFDIRISDFPKMRWHRGLSSVRFADSENKSLPYYATFCCVLRAGFLFCSREQEITTAGSLTKVKIKRHGQRTNVSVCKKI